MKNMMMGCLLAGFSLFILATVPAFAEGPAGISLAGAAVPFIEGDAGTGIGAPQYDDIFDSGWGIRMEPYYDFSQELRGLIGFTYQSWSGGTYSGFEFDDLNLWSFYFGIKYRFFPGSAVRPYVLADFGYAHLDSVDISTGGAKATYWDDTNTYLLDFGGGVELVISQNFSMYVDIRQQIFGEPDSALPPSSDAESPLSMPISVGLNLNF